MKTVVKPETHRLTALRGWLIEQGLPGYSLDVDLLLGYADDVATNFDELEEEIEVYKEALAEITVANGLDKKEPRIEITT